VFRQDRANPSTAVSTWKGRKDLPKANPSTAVSAWMNGGLAGGGAFNAYGGVITQWNGQASVLTDSSGNGNHGTTSGAKLTAAAAKQGSYGLRTSSSNIEDRYWRGATLSAMGATSAFSFSGWSKFTGTAVMWDSITGGGNSSWTLGFGIYVSAAASPTSVTIRAWKDNYSVNYIEATGVNPQNYNHYALTYDGSTLTFYINGSSIGTKSVSGAVTDSAVGIGGYTQTPAGDAYTYDGYCDEYGYWDSALTSAEVTAIYNSGTPLDLTSDSGNYVSSADLEGYYRFNTRNTYRVHTFRGTGTFTVSAGSADVDYLFVAGGGGGGNSSTWDECGGGGGAGGVTTATGVAVTAGTYTITVGAGGSGAAAGVGGANGGNSSAFSETAAVGGGLGGHGTAHEENGATGGSGGGGSGETGGNGAGTGGAATAGQGNAGGAGVGSNGRQGGGGGGKGGAGAAGTGAAGSGVGGAGGAGGTGHYGITASTVGYAGGGGGGSDNTSSQAAGGSYGGGKGGFNSGAANYSGAGGVPNTGGGGGGTYGIPGGTYPGGDGASGIVLIRYVVA